MRPVPPQEYRRRCASHMPISSTTPTSRKESHRKNLVVGLDGAPGAFGSTPKLRDMASRVDPAPWPSKGASRMMPSEWVQNSSRAPDDVSTSLAR